MSQHSKYDDGKVLRSKDQTLFSPDLMVLVNNLSTGNNSVADLRIHDKIQEKVNDALDRSDFADEYRNAVADTDAKVASDNIVNGVAVTFLYESAIRPIMYKYADAPAPDVLVSKSEWDWALKRWRSRDNFGGSDANKRVVLRIADVLENAIGYRISANKTIEIEGDDEADE